MLGKGGLHDDLAQPGGRARLVPPPCVMVCAQPFGGAKIAGEQALIRIQDDHEAHVGEMMAIW